VKIGVGVYGDNGHQIHRMLPNTPNSLVDIVGVCCCKKGEQWTNAVVYSSLEEMLKDEKIQLVSLCSPRRDKQAADAILCLEAGKHVYAEKPCAMNEDELDLIIKTAQKTGKQFHEMAGTAFMQPYYEMGKIVKGGRIGEVVQVFAQKSYSPALERRPGDEGIDGGLIGQNGIHAIRMIEHVTGLEITDVEATETKLGNKNKGELHMAASIIARLSNGGVASCVINYLNPQQGFGSHTNEHLRIFGTLGFVESVDGGCKTRLVLNDQDRGELDLSEPGLDYFDLFISSISGQGEMPLSIEHELHPTRVVIRAKQNADSKKVQINNR